MPAIPIAIDVARQHTSGGVLNVTIRPPVGKMWWFKSMRWSADWSADAGSYVALLRVGSTVTMVLYLAQDFEPTGFGDGSMYPTGASKGAGEVGAGGVATYNNYLRLDLAVGAKCHMSFLGIETDYTNL